MKTEQIYILKYPVIRNRI